MRGKARQGGFTLIELVVVITILGILAAFAIPRFASLETEARAAAVQGLAGSVRSGAALAHALWLAQGEPPAGVTMEGSPITMTFGYPDLGTIDDTLADTSGFDYNATTGVFAKETGSGTPIANCQITYAPPTVDGQAPTVTPVTTGC